MILDTCTAAVLVLSEFQVIGQTFWKQVPLFGFRIMGNQKLFTYFLDLSITYDKKEK